MDKKVLTFLILIFLFSFFFRMSFSIISPVKYWDETIYSNLGRNILIYHEYSFLHGFADFATGWPLAGFRPPLLPVIISIVSMVTFNPFFLSMIVPLIGALSVVGIFFLVRKIFDGRTAVYASIIFSLVPLNVFWGSKILNDIVFLSMIVFACFYFWKSFYEKGKNSDSIFFGVFCALAFLSRYSMLWFFPVFLILLILETRVKFIFDKKLWIAIASFGIVILPWFVYNYFSYNSLLGFLIHANESTLRWGSQPIFFYLSYLKSIWFLLLLFIPAFFNFKEKKKALIFMLAWFAFVFISASLMGHKEERYLLPILPAVCAISAFGISKLGRYRNVFFSVVIIILLAGNWNNFSMGYPRYFSEDTSCLMKTMEFIRNSNVSYIVTEHFSPVYFYTLKKNIRVNNYTETISLITENYPNETIYYYYVKGDWFDLLREFPDLKTKVLFSCGDKSVFELQNKIN